MIRKLNRNNSFKMALLLLASLSFHSTQAQKIGLYQLDYDNLHSAIKEYWIDKGINAQRLANDTELDVLPFYIRYSQKNYVLSKQKVKGVDRQRILNQIPLKVSISKDKREYLRNLNFSYIVYLNTKNISEGKDESIAELFSHKKVKKVSDIFDKKRYGRKLDYKNTKGRLRATLVFVLYDLTQNKAHDLVMEIDNRDFGHKYSIEDIVMNIQALNKKIEQILEGREEGEIVYDTQPSNSTYPTRPRPYPAPSNRPLPSSSTIRPASPRPRKTTRRVFIPDVPRSALPRIMVLPKTVDGSKYRNGEYEMKPNDRILIGALKYKLEENGLSTIGFESSLKKLTETQAIKEDAKKDLKSKILDSSGADFYIEVSEILESDCITTYEFKIRVHSTSEDVATDSRGANTCAKGLSSEYKNFAASILNQGALEKLKVRFKEVINNRMASMNVSVHESSTLILSSSIKNVDLENHIENAVKKYSANENYRISGLTNYEMVFSEIYVPVVLQNQEKYGANAFTRDIKKYLKENAGIDTNITIIGTSISLEIR